MRGDSFKAVYMSVIFGKVVVILLGGGGGDFVGGVVAIMLGEGWRLCWGSGGILI